MDGCSSFRHVLGLRYTQNGIGKGHDPMAFEMTSQTQPVKRKIVPNQTDPIRCLKHDALPQVTAAKVVFRYQTNAIKIKRKHFEI